MQASNSVWFSHQSAAGRQHLALKCCRKALKSAEKSPILKISESSFSGQKQQKPANNCRKTLVFMFYAVKSWKLSRISRKNDDLPHFHWENKSPKLDFVIFRGYSNSRSISLKISCFHSKTLDFAYLSAVYTESVYCICSIYWSVYILNSIYCARIRAVLVQLSYILPAPPVLW